MPAVVFVALEQSSNDDIGVGVQPIFRDDGGDSLSLRCTRRHAFGQSERDSSATPQPLTPAEARIPIAGRHKESSRPRIINCLKVVST